MKSKGTTLAWLLGLALGVSLSSCDGNDDNHGGNPTAEYTDSIAFNFMAKTEAAELLGKSDHHSRSLSRFSLHALLGSADATEADYLRFAAAQANDWPAGSKAAAKSATDSINGIMRRKGMRLRFPNPMNIALITQREEGGSGGYTRGTTITLNCLMFDGTPAYYHLQTLAHEAFHVLTRTNPDLRRKLYSLIGFTVLPKSVEMPAGLADYVIDNPDVNAHDSYATFTIGGRKRDCVMLLYSQRDYAGGRYWDYFTVGLLEIDPQTCKAVLDADGRHRLYGVDEAVDFYDKVGRNTSYVIDPEEVLADNFSFLFSSDISRFPSQELLVNIEKVCRGE